MCEQTGGAPLAKCYYYVASTEPSSICAHTVRLSLTTALTQPVGEMSWLTRCASACHIRKVLPN